jgi:type II secretory pathway predicted ATPase ExeA
MYHAHFGLERGLFGEGIATDAAVFRSAKVDRLIAHFKLALASASSIIVLRGTAGVGKTTVTAAALRASSTRLALAWLNGLPTNAAELLELLLVELGVNTLRTTRIERLQLWRQFQAEMRATDSRLFIIAERTEDLSPDVLHALDQLTAPDAAGNPGANVVLLGHAGIDEHLAAPLLDSLRQRIRLKAELEPFTEAELQDYLRHQVACAEGHFDRIFAPGTVAALHRYSQGITRLANTLCESALDIATIQRQKQLTAELVAKTAMSLLGLAEPVPAGRPVAAPASVGAPASVAAPAPVPGPEAVASPASVTAPVTAPAPASPVAVAVETRPAPQAATLVTLAPARPTETPAAPAPVFVAPVATFTAATPAHAPPAATARPAAATPSPPAATSGAPVAATAPAPLWSARAPLVAAAAAATQPKPVEIEYDGSATDVADVAGADFPILTDAVEMPSPGPVAKRVAAPPTPPAPLSAPAALPPAATKTVHKPASRVETAYTASRPALKPLVVPAASQEPEAEDGLRQTQTMRAISVAKSIDDISELDAETLFSDAELDLVSAALASAAEWPDDDEPAPAPVSTPKAAPAPPPAKPAAAKVAPPADDPFDLFGLGDDAPLELIDDSAPTPDDRTRKSAAR